MFTYHIYISSSWWNNIASTLIFHHFFYHISLFLSTLSLIIAVYVEPFDCFHFKMLFITAYQESKWLRIRWGILSNLTPNISQIFFIHIQIWLLPWQLHLHVRTRSLLLPSPSPSSPDSLPQKRSFWVKASSSRGSCYNDHEVPQKGGHVELLSMKNEYLARNQRFELLAQE